MLYCLYMDEDKIILKLIEHDEALKEIREHMFTKEESKQLFGALEDITTIIKTIREEQVFSIEWMKRMQDLVDRHEQELQKIKFQLKMA